MTQFNNQLKKMNTIIEEMSKDPELFDSKFIDRLSQTLDKTMNVVKNKLVEMEDSTTC